MSASRRSPATPAPRRNSAGPGRPKDLAKREAVLRAATTLFMEQGYAGTSMDAVAAAAGVSKLTVYSHFGDKEGLFNAAVQATCAAMMPPALFQPDDGAPLREQLLQIAVALHGLVGSPASLATQRIMLDPATDNHIRQLFWQAGPQCMHTTFAAFLRRLADSDQLAIADVDTAARQFFHLVHGQLLTELMSGQAAAPDSTPAPSPLAAAVDLFLRAHSPQPN